MDLYPIQEIFSHSCFEVYLTQDLKSFKLQAFDHSLSRLFQLEVFENSVISKLTNDFCKTKDEFFKILSQSLCENSSKSIVCFIDNNGLLHYQCNIQFPLEKIISFEIELQHVELNEFKHAELHICSLSYQVALLEKKILKEENSGGLYENELISPNFSNTFNAKNFVFTNDNRTVIRNSNNNSQYITVWGDKFIKRHGKQAFEVKIEEINMNFNYSNAIIGVNKIDYMGENIYKGKGCYNLMKEKVFFDRSEFLIGNVFFKGDVVRVVADFEKLELSWFRNNSRITTVKFVKDEEDNFDLYPVVSLKFEKESVSFL